MVCSEGNKGNGLVQRPLVIKDQPLARGVVVAEGVLGEGVGLELGIGVGKIKLHCKSMEGLLLKTAEQVVPHHHLGVLEVRKASQLLLIYSFCGHG